MGQEEGLFSEAGSAAPAAGRPGVSRFEEGFPCAGFAVCSRAGGGRPGLSAGRHGRAGAELHRRVRQWRRGQ